MDTSSELKQRKEKKVLEPVSFCPGSGTQSPLSCGQINCFPLLLFYIAFYIISFKSLTYAASFWYTMNRASPNKTNLSRLTFIKVDLIDRSVKLSF